MRGCLKMAMFRWTIVKDLMLYTMINCWIFSGSNFFQTCVDGHVHISRFLHPASAGYAGTMTFCGFSTLNQIPANWQLDAAGLHGNTSKPDS